MKILRITGFVVFFLFSFMVGVYVTFPWDALKDRLTIQLSETTGWDVTAEELAPSWIAGVRVTGLELKPPDVGESLVVDEVIARGRLLTLLTGGLGVSAWVPVGKGEVDVVVSKRSDSMAVQADAQSVELGLIPGFVAFTGLPLSGVVDLEADVVLDQEDTTESSGEVHLVGKGLELGEGGKIGNYPVPALRLGDLDWTVEFEEGRADIPRQELRGGDVDLDLEGSIDLATPIERTTLDLLVAFRPTPEFLGENPILKALLKNISRARGNDGFYSYAVSGSVKHPRTFPKRR